MEIFEDKERNLKWLIYSAFEVKDNSHIDENLINTFSSMNEWETENIREFISHMSPIPTGDYIRRYLSFNFNTLQTPDARQVYFLVALEDDELAGIVTMNANSSDIYNDFNLDGEEKYNIKLDHIIINPNKLMKGLATRMTLSIANNQDIFAQKVTSCGLTVEIDPANTASLKLAENCGFKAYSLLSILNYWLVRLYRSDHTPQNHEIPISKINSEIENMHN